MNNETKNQLEFEPSTQYDDYGRLLAYVFLLDGTLFNAELIKQGYARVKLHLLPSITIKSSAFMNEKQG